eukprot:Gregarina_sp_Poly_1__1731@NODE_1446_length_4130_cov_51_014029_g958_i0_p5_GENE_NODE_1446_length_4130_cov_51_014029_g958_i0NODE_1446_length_4130_cov_51_014029_g958_i0_p5_ORF_typecomplete_len136_score6_99_NODE_1446_length_4130_cov_51_014029_g958_i011671574
MVSHGLVLIFKMRRYDHKSNVCALHPAITHTSSFANSRHTGCGPKCPKLALLQLGTKNQHVCVQISKSPTHISVTPFPAKTPGKSSQPLPAQLGHSNILSKSSAPQGRLETEKPIHESHFRTYQKLQTHFKVANS